MAPSQRSGPRTAGRRAARTHWHTDTHAAGTGLAAPPVDFQSPRPGTAVLSLPPAALGTAAVVPRGVTEYMRHKLQSHREQRQRYALQRRPLERRRYIYLHQISDCLRFARAGGDTVPRAGPSALPGDSASKRDRRARPTSPGMAHRSASRDPPSSPRVPARAARRLCRRPSPPPSTANKRYCLGYRPGGRAPVCQQTNYERHKHGEPPACIRRLSASG